MKRILRIILALIVIAAVVKFAGPDIFKPTTIRAFGDLNVDFHVPLNAPIFTITNMAPGDAPVSRNVDVNNGGSVTHLIEVKGVRTGGVGADPKLEAVLNIVINDGTSDIYGGTAGTKTVADFFADSSNPDGIALGNVGSGNSKTYTFTVNFPSSAGNDFQAKSVIFDLTFGDGTEPTPTPSNTPTPTTRPSPTPTTKPTPTPSGNLCGNIKVNIFGNGSGSVNGVKIVCKNFKVVSQTNTTTSTTNVTSITNSGGNTSVYNTNTSSSIKTGSSSTTTTTTVTGGTNITH